MQKHTIKLLLKKNKKNQNGHYPIYLRITVDRKTSFFSTSFYIEEKLWDSRNEQVRKDHPYYEQINQEITLKKKQAWDELIKSGMEQQTTSANIIKQSLSNKLDKKDVFAYAENFIRQSKDRLTKEKKTIINWNTSLNKLEMFLGKRKLPFSEVTIEFMNEYENWLRTKGVRKKRGSPNNYINIVLGNLKTICNEAKRDRIIKENLISDYTLPSRKNDDKEYLSQTELDQIENYLSEDIGNVQRQALIYFLFGCYTGLRVSDWYKFRHDKNVYKGFIHMKTTKTKDDAVIPIKKRLKRIIELMKGVPLTIPISSLNIVLKPTINAIGINKRITTHCARKTFAITRCLEMNISSETAAKMMAVGLNVFEKSYSKITAVKVRKETDAAWEED